MARRSYSGSNPESVAGVASGDASLARLAKRAAQLAALKSALWPHLPEDVRPHCDLANYRDSTLVLTADSSVWATRLRHTSSRILHIARSNFKIPVNAIEVQVRPPEQSREPERHPRSLSKSASDSLSRAAQACPDDQLKAAFQRLAEKSENKP